MNNFMINLFIPRTQDGSAAAIIAHIYAYNKVGAVSIVRCEDDGKANQEIQKLLCHITIANGYQAPQPTHREIWCVGFHINAMVQDELNLFKMTDAEHIVTTVDSAESLYNDMIFEAHFPSSLGIFLCKLGQKNNDYELLYNMLDDDDFENLIAYLLHEHPNATDVAKEDYVLNMFVEHEKKRRASYI